MESTDEPQNETQKEIEKIADRLDENHEYVLIAVADISDDNLEIELISDFDQNEDTEFTIFLEGIEGIIEKRKI